MEIELLHKETTEQIIKAFYKVYNTLGFGFLEKVYENALSAELITKGFQVENQKRLEVYYENRLVGEYFADIIVAEKIIVELKSAESLHPAHEAQLMNYLKATEIEIGLLLNFGVKPEFKRKVFTNARKTFRTKIE